VSKERKDAFTAAFNRRARYDYEIKETFEAGIVLMGSEVKSIRGGHISLSESYADFKGGELFLVNCQISEYKQANRFNHEPKRPRKLLLHAKQIKRLYGQIKRDHMTLIPLSLYFNKRGIVKLEIGIAKGKKQYDKRETEKQRDWQRQKSRVMKNNDE
jgi:SsrA-binding protein